MVDEKKIDETVIEVQTAAEANRLYATGKYGKPRYSERRDCYVLIKLDDKRTR